MTNAEIRKIVFDKIKEFGFKIYNIENVDGYFICEMGKDSVTHFRLKGKGMWKHWKFGLWLHSEYMSDKDNKVIQLFAQHDTWIDKFKPSRSALLFELNASEFDNFLNNNDKNIYGESYTFYRLKTMLGMMVKHPFICYDEYCGDCIGYTDKSFIFNYIKYELQDKLTELKKQLLKLFWLPYTKIKIAMCKNSNIINNIVLYDFEKENDGWSTDYLYQVRITFNKDVSDEQMCKWINLWWKKIDME